LRFEAATFGGFGLFFGVSFHGRHGAFLPLDGGFNRKATMPQVRGGCPMI
jgi:hypothetical protein